MPNKKPNRLISEKSSYLLQHAYNPVDWYPWDDEAFEKAKRENKPIFLSIGYSTCHWCHVMEHESFEDQDVAELMNEVFVSIKVDREERPDLDHIYMAICQMLTGSGGWPLTIIMTPEKKPFFAATYIPKSNRLGRIGMTELIPRIKEVWLTRKDEVMQSAEKIVSALKETDSGATGEDLNRSVLDKAHRELYERFEETHGGFSQAPKFPTPHNLSFLLRYWKRNKDENSLAMVEQTLEAMRHGGVYDQIGYGFHRYSTDKEWLVPHFEKMLYDQALLAMVYLEAYQATGKEMYGNTAKEIFEYVLRDMTSPEGGFYSAEDADSEGIEGKFYVWKEDEIFKALGKEDAEIIAKTFNIEKGGNFNDEATGRKSGSNILHLKKPLGEIASKFNMTGEEFNSKLASFRKRLFDIREKRVHPYKDDKILTDWNGLMIAALSIGGKILGDQTYTNAAKSASEFILKKMKNKEGRLLHRYRDGETKVTANLDDYAFTIWGLIELYEATFETRYLKVALELNSDMLSYFWDSKKGGLYFTPEYGETLITRKREIYDGAIPSGNSVAMFNLVRLGRITGTPALEDKAEEIARAFSDQVKKVPSGFTQFLVAADFLFGPSFEVVIVGKSDSTDTTKMLGTLNEAFLPSKVVILRPSENKSPEIDKLADFIKSHVTMNGKATAYVCTENACKAPTTDPKKMLELMAGPS